MPRAPPKAEPLLKPSFSKRESGGTQSTERLIYQYLSRCAGLNCGPRSYQERALPTELQRLINFYTYQNSYNRKNIEAQRNINLFNKFFQYKNKYRKIFILWSFKIELKFLRDRADLNRQPPA